MYIFLYPTVYYYILASLASPSERFKDYRRVSVRHRTDSGTQLRTLLYVIDKETRGVFETPSISAEQRESYEVCMQGFKAHFVHPTNEVYERVHFLNRVRESGESVDGFLTALHKMVIKYSYESVARG